MKEVGVMTERGRMIVIVGPSGSGKDTLIRWVKERMMPNDEVLFVRRVITREACDHHEDHDSVNEAAFEAAANEGAFCVTWQAHGLSYGVPSSVASHLCGGGIAILNGARRALSDLNRCFPGMFVIHITTQADILRERLLARGRETADDVERRLKEACVPVEGNFDTIEIDNSGTIDAAGQALMKAVSSTIHKAETR